VGLDREVEFFDEFADEADYDVLGERGYARLLAAFNESVQPRKGQRCVDLGCGTGAFTRRLRVFGLDLMGIDISPRSIERARSIDDGIRYEVGDITATALAEDSFDVAALSGVLHHITARADRIRAMREALRILLPGGHLYAFDPNAHSPSMFLYRDPRSPLYSSEGKTENEVLLRRDELTGELRESGFTEVRVRGVSGTTFKYVKGRIARFLLPAYAVYEELVRLSPWEGRFGTFLVSTATKPARKGPPKG
jgi:SAM-dependent methyltransferase